MPRSKKNKDEITTHRIHLKRSYLNWSKKWNHPTFNSYRSKVGSQNSSRDPRQTRRKRSRNITSPTLTSRPKNHRLSQLKSLKTRVHNVQPDPLKNCKNNNNDDENGQPRFAKKEIQQNEDKVRVGIKNLAKETIYLAASPEETILQFKQRMTGFWTLTPAKFQVLKLGDKILENDTLISDLALDSVLTFEKA